MAEQKLAAKRPGQIFQRREHTPRIHQPVRRRKKKLAQLEQREQSATTPVRVQHGQHTDVMLVHQAQRGGGGRVRLHAKNFGLHYIAHLGRNIGNEARRGHAESFQHKINALVGVAAARGHGFRHAGAPLEFRIADGRADRVRVRIAVADDKNFAHFNFCGSRRESAQISLVWGSLWEKSADARRLLLFIRLPALPLRVVRFHLRPDFFDPAIRSDEKRDAIDAQILPPHEAFLAPHPVSLDDFLVLIRQQREWQFEFFDELIM